MLGSVSEALQSEGLLARQFLSLQGAVREGGELALKEISQRKPCLKNRIEAHIEQAIVGLVTDQPAYGQVRLANELAKRGLFAGTPSILRILNVPASTQICPSIEPFSLRLGTISSTYSEVSRTSPVAEKQNHNSSGRCLSCDRDWGKDAGLASKRKTMSEATWLWENRHYHWRKRSLESGRVNRIRPLLAFA